MLKKYLFVSMMLALGITVLAQSYVLNLTQDSISIPVNRIEIAVQQNLDFYRTVNRYAILSDLSNCAPVIENNWKIQELMEKQHRLNLPFEENLLYLQKMFPEDVYAIQKREDLNLMMGLWRSRIVNIKRDAELPAAIQYGMNYFLPQDGLGWTDYMYFITLIMQEHYDYHYDYQRVKPSRPSAGDVLGVADMFKAFRAYDTVSVGGVCRDIHEVGLRMLREMGNQYFNYHYPEKSISMDHYLYLVSWVTQSSHHVTLIAQNPLQMNQQFEMDWGRLIQKENIRGYDHGRNYGNVYRIWQYDDDSRLVKPLDFRKTNIGAVLDQRIYLPQEKFMLGGIDQQESYSYAGYQRNKNNHTIDIAHGTMANDQSFTVLSYVNRWENKKHFLQTSGAFAAQAMQLNDVAKKNVFFPGYDFSLSTATVLMPRIMAGFNTRPLRLLPTTELSFFGIGSLEAMVNAQHFTSVAQPYTEFSSSGDGGFYCSQGMKLRWRSALKNKQLTFTGQNRSFVIPREIRLMTVDPVVLLKSLSWVNAAQDLMLHWQHTSGTKYSYALAMAAEHTQGKRLYGNVQASFTYKPNAQLTWQFMAGSFRRIKGMDLFWYGPDADSCTLSLNLARPALSFSVSGRRLDNRELNLSASLAYAMP